MVQAHRAVELPARLGIRLRGLLCLTLLSLGLRLGFALALRGLARADLPHVSGVLLVVLIVLRLGVVPRLEVHLAHLLRLVRRARLLLLLLLRVLFLLVLLAVVVPVLLVVVLVLVVFVERGLLHKVPVLVLAVQHRERRDEREELLAVALLLRGGAP